MAKATLNQIKSTIQPLIPLEYCSPERAARLLGCEVEDIFHWAIIGAINIYAEFQEYEIDTPQYHVHEMFIDENIPDTQETKEVEYISEGVMKVKKINIGDIPPFYEDEKNSISNWRYFQYGAGMRSPTQGDWYNRKVSLRGFWAIEPQCIPQLQLVTDSDSDSEFDWDLTAVYIGTDTCPEQENSSQKVITLFGLEHLNDITKRLRLMREDLLKIQRHMASGEVMSKKSSNLRPEKAPPMQKDDEQVTRITANQSRAIVELLGSHGYSTEELKGSVEELQKKITRNGHSKQLSTVTAHTLKAWLERAGVR
ncbi:hypothetical protein ACK39F_02140 [Aeromonas veronii]|uniref:hypothetical protein n=1 Tax=Aeromonas sp. R3-1 TaxID=3138463 RepID=UPI0034A26E14